MVSYAGEVDTSNFKFKILNPNPAQRGWRAHIIGTIELLKLSNLKFAK